MEFSKELQEKIKNLFKNNKEWRDKLLLGDPYAIKQIGEIIDSEILIPVNIITSTKGSANISAANALPKNPARVIATWIVDKNLAGSEVSLEIFFAFLASLPPLDIKTLSFVSFIEITAISAQAKTALRQIKNTCKNTANK